jgi:hypothetical protein
MNIIIVYLVKLFQKFRFVVIFVRDLHDYSGGRVERGCPVVADPDLQHVFGLDFTIKHPIGCAAI